MVDLQKLRAVLSWQPARKWGHQSDNCKELSKEIDSPLESERNAALPNSNSSPVRPMPDF